MRTTISFVNKKNDEFITTIYDNANDYFKIGQKLYINFEMLSPKKYGDIRNTHGKAIADVTLQVSENHQKKYPIAKRYKIVSQVKTLTRNPNINEGHQLKIEYYVKESPVFYWKWWYIKSLFKFKK